MIADKQKDKIKERQAVEDFYGNFVEAQLQIEVQQQPQQIPSNEILHPSPSLLLGLLLWFFIVGLNMHHLCRMNKRK